MKKSRLLLLIMRIDRLRSSKKIDWIRIGFICSEHQGLSLEQIEFCLTQMFKWSKTRREISAIIKAYSTKGFRIEINQMDSKKIYFFEGTIVEIHPKTIGRWKKKLEPLKGFIIE